MTDGGTEERRSAGCETRSCHSSSKRYAVALAGVTRKVCRPCMLELVGLGGWEFTGVVDGPDLQVRGAVIPTIN